MGNFHWTNSVLARRMAAALITGAAVSALAITAAAPAHAQEVNASLRGRISGAGEVTQITAVEVNTGINRTVSVNANGDYNFASLRPGDYRLEITTADRCAADRRVQPFSCAECPA